MEGEETFGHQLLIAGIARKEKGMAAVRVQKRRLGMWVRMAGG